MSGTEKYISEIEARRLIVGGCKLEVFSLMDAYFEGGGVKGKWRIDVLDSQNNRYSVRLAQKQAIKFYKTPTGLFSFFASSGFSTASIPLLANESIVIAPDKHLSRERDQ
jgi:hypothetical protein